MFLYKLIDCPEYAGNAVNHLINTIFMRPSRQFTVLHRTIRTSSPGIESLRYMHSESPVYGFPHTKVRVIIAATQSSHLFVLT